MRRKVLSKCCNVPMAISKSVKKGTRIICSHCGKNFEAKECIRKRFDIYIPFPITPGSKIPVENVKLMPGGRWFVPASKINEPRIINLKHKQNGSKQNTQKTKKVCKAGNDSGIQ